MRIKIPKDPRLIPLLELLRHHCPELSSYISSLRESISSENGTDNILANYASSCSVLLTPSLTAKL